MYRDQLSPINHPIGLDKLNNLDYLSAKIKRKHHTSKHQISNHLSKIKESKRPSFISAHSHQKDSLNKYISNLLSKTNISLKKSTQFSLGRAYLGFFIPILDDKGNLIFQKSGIIEYILLNLSK